MEVKSSTKPYLGGSNFKNMKIPSLRLLLSLTLALTGILGPSISVLAQALLPTGSVVAWGLGPQTNVPPGLSNAVAIAAGGTETMAVKEDRTVVAWGDNVYGETNVPAGLGNVVAIAAGCAHAVALKQDGSVVAWGRNQFGEINVPLAAQSGVIAVATGCEFTLALKQNGTVVAWGYND